MINWLQKSLLLSRSTKRKCNSDKQIKKKTVAGVDKNIHNTSELIKKIDYNTKMTEIENKIPYASGLVSKSSFDSKSTDIEKH